MPSLARVLVPLMDIWSRRRQVWRDLLFTFFSQAAAALLSLALVKYATLRLNPEFYGQASLIIGVHNLLRAVFVLPLLQLALYQEDARSAENRWGSIRNLLAIAPLAAALPMLFFVWKLPIGSIDRCLALGLLILMLWVEADRNLHMNLLHREGRMGTYGAWLLLDALVRPFFFVVLILVFQPRGNLLVGAHLLGALVTRSAMWIWEPRPGLRLTAFGPALRILRQRATFLLPLAIQGMAFWFNGVGDRYFVARLLSTASAGIYAGVYGLFSMPIGICGGAMTLVVRPRLVERWNHKNYQAYCRLLVGSFLGYALFQLGLLLFLCITSDFWIRLLLQPSYLQGKPAILGLLLGQWLLSNSSFLEMHLYIEGRTRLILGKNILAALGAAIAIPIMVSRWGLAGAGWACVLYFGIDFLITLGWVTRRVLVVSRSLKGLES